MEAFVVAFWYYAYLVLQITSLGCLKDGLERCTWAGHLRKRQKATATSVLHSRPPIAPSTVFLGLMLISCVRPRVFPNAYAPVSAAIVQATAMKVAMRPTVMCEMPPKRTCALGPLLSCKVFHRTWHFFDDHQQFVQANEKGCKRTGQLCTAVLLMAGAASTLSLIQKLGKYPAVDIHDSVSNESSLRQHSKSLDSQSYCSQHKVALRMHDAWGRTAIKQAEH